MKRLMVLVGMLLATSAVLGSPSQATPTGMMPRTFTRM